MSWKISQSKHVIALMCLSEYKGNLYNSRITQVRLKLTVSISCIPSYDAHFVVRLCLIINLSHLHFYSSVLSTVVSQFSEIAHMDVTNRQMQSLPVFRLIFAKNIYRYSLEL